jgi:cytochrome c biogenesis protein CcmG, thiol:disulfide interchange protein DsbE
VTGDALPPLPDPATGAADPAVGLTAPVVAGSNFEGIGVEIGHGSPTLAVFVAHWCPHCQAEVPDLVEWNANAQVPAGVRVVGVATSTDERRPNYPPSDWLVGEGFPWPVIADSDTFDAAAAFGVSGYPFFVFVDADGSVLWRSSGEMPMDELTQRIQDSLAA